jgi:hypothetical protein
MHGQLETFGSSCCSLFLGDIPVPPWNNEEKLLTAREYLDLWPEFQLDASGMSHSVTAEPLRSVYVYAMRLYTL